MPASEKCRLRDTRVTVHEVITPLLNYFITKHALTLITYNSGSRKISGEVESITLAVFPRGSD
jgi:hypothetical protein